jgi:hypothetical protein
MRGAVRCALFGANQNAGAAKSREIMRLFDIGPLGPQWPLPSRLAENPLVSMIRSMGSLWTLRTMTRELQEHAYELGLIPFVPAARGDTDGAN